MIDIVRQLAAIHRDVYKRTGDSGEVVASCSGADTRRRSKTCGTR